MLEEKISRRYKILVAIGAVFASSTMIASIISACIKDEAPDPKQLGPVKGLAYMGSKNFARLPKQEKEKYVKKCRQSYKAYRYLTPRQRRAITRNTYKIHMAKFRKKMDDFFSMTPAEQEAHLDKEAAKIRSWKRKWKSRKRTKTRKVAQKKSTKKKKGGGINAWRQNYLEGTDSTSRAQAMEYFKRLVKRLKKK